MAQEASLGVLDLEGLAKQRVLAQIYHTEREVQRGLEEVIEIVDFLLGERLALDGGASRPIRADALDVGLLSHGIGKGLSADM